MTANTHATCKFSEWIEFNDAWRPTFVVTRHHCDEHIAQLAKQFRIPTASQARSFVVAGGLVSYGSNLTESFLRTAIYVDRILRGAKPADLPVEQPTRFETVINRRTAAALGLTIPQSVLLRADEVIE